ncbi:MAG: MerR family DNA-binding transcriptional regulator [Actinomycetota bacterium]
MTRTDSANDAGTPNQTGTANGAVTASDADTPSDARTWTIAEVADEFAITHRTIRHYEELNLISPERRGTARIYHRRERTRLNLILRGKRLGFPLEEIRTIIDLYDEPTGQASQLRYVLDQLHERRGHLERRRHDIEDALDELDEFERRCQSDLSQLARQGQQPESAT